MFIAVLVLCGIGFCVGVAMLVIAVTSLKRVPGTSAPDKPK